MRKKAQIEQPVRLGRKSSLNAEYTAVLRAITLEQPRSSLDEVTRELFRRAGVKVSTVTVGKVLREAGIERLKPLRRASERVAVQGVVPARHGYTAAHRRADGPISMNTDLTDAEWALVSDLFERDGQRGAPEPNAANIDAQSTRSTAQGGTTGFDVGKKVPLAAVPVRSADAWERVRESIRGKTIWCLPR